MTSTTVYIKDLTNIGNITTGDKVVVERVTGETRLANYRVELAEDTTPQLGGNLDVNGKHIVDASGNELIKLTAVASAINEITISNASTGSGPLIEVTGGDTNAPLRVLSKGTGTLSLEAATTTPITVKSGTGYQHTTIFSITDSANSRTVTLPDFTGAIPLLASWGSSGQLLQSDGTGQPGWTTSIWPSAVGSAGKIIRSDGTANVYSTSSFADTYAVNSLVYAASADSLSGLATANASVLRTDSSGVPSWFTPTSGQYRVLLGDSTNGITEPVSAGTTRQVLSSGNGSNRPSWRTVYTAEQTAFEAYRATSNQSINSSTLTKVQLNAEITDVGSWFDSTTNFRYTPNKSGFYQINASAAISSLGDGKTFQVIIYYNGAAYKKEILTIGAISSVVANVSTVIQLNAPSDYVELYVFHDHGSARDILFGADLTSLSGGLIGEIP